MNDFDERGQFELGYGFFPGGDPRDFTPDYEMCSPEEIERWKVDVALAEAGFTVVTPPSGQWIYDQDGKPVMHILAPKYGMGTYQYRLQDEDMGDGFMLVEDYDSDEYEVDPNDEVLP